MQLISSASLMRMKFRALRMSESFGGLQFAIGLRLGVALQRVRFLIEKYGRGSSAGGGSSSNYRMHAIVRASRCHEGKQRHERKELTEKWWAKRWAIS